MRRRLYRLSALFELADEQFSGARAVAEERLEEYASNLRGGNLNVPIDLSSLQAYLDESKRVGELAEVAVSVNAPLRVIPFSTEPDRQERDRSDLINTLARHDIKSLADFDALLASPDAPTMLRDYVSAYKAFRNKSKGPSWFIEDMLNILVFLLLPDPSKEEISAIYGVGLCEPLFEVLDAK